jgi:hypothetical protein
VFDKRYSTVQGFTVHRFTVYYFVIFLKNQLISLKYPSLLPLSLFDFHEERFRHFPNSPIRLHRRGLKPNDLDDVVDDEEDEDEVWIGLVLGDGGDL